MLRVFVLALLSTLVTGCANMLNVGASEYSCSGMPEGVTCVSARDVYTATESSDYQTQLMREQNAAQAEKDGPKRPLRRTQETAAEAPVAPQLRPEPGLNAPIPARTQNPLPIRTQAVVMRIAVDPWEDEKGDLDGPGYIYTEIEPRRWEIGARNTGIRNTISPLNSRQ